MDREPIPSIQSLIRRIFTSFLHLLIPLTSIPSTPPITGATIRSHLLDICKRIVSGSHKLSSDALSDKKMMIKEKEEDVDEDEAVIKSHTSKKM